MQKNKTFSNSALILIDMQQAVDHPVMGKRNNLKAEECAGYLLSCWRKINYPIYHIRHDSTEPKSPYRPGQSGNNFKSEVAPHPTETIIVKRTNSAFIGTDFEAVLRAANINTLIITGVSTSNSVEATVRMAGNLGFNTYLIADATFTFERSDWSGRYRSAEEVHDMSLANLHGEYCTVTTADKIIEMVTE